MSNKITSKQLILGKPLSTRRLEGELLPKLVALPIFSSDPLSSVAYGPQELLMVLALGGVGTVSALVFASWIAGAVVALLTIIVLSYRKVIAHTPPVAATTRSRRRTSAKERRSLSRARSSSTTS